MTPKTPMRTIQSMLTLFAMAGPRDEMRSELAKPKRNAEPISMKPEEKAPSTKYLSAASKDS